MKNLNVIRTHTSPYQAANFAERERLALSEIPGIHYTNLKELNPENKTILITNTHTKLRDFPQEVLDQTSLIIHPNSGYDNFTEDYELFQHIPLVVGHKIRAQGVAEYSLNCLFEGCGLLPRHMSWEKKRKWERKLIAERNIWVFGYGHIGKIVADTLKTLGANVTVVDPYLHDTPHGQISHWSEGKLEQADVVISCMGLNQKNHHYFNQDFFEASDSKLLFINGSRGKLVNEVALKAFLQKNPEAFAFLDVFEEEPFAENWHSFPQVWKTSHIAGVSTNLDSKIIDFEVEVLKDYLELNTNFFMMKYYKELIQNKWIEGVLI